MSGKIQMDNAATALAESRGIDVTALTRRSQLRSSAVSAELEAAAGTLRLSSLPLSACRRSLGRFNGLT
ncbi:hypothetical protein SKAU_G00404390 [Synaphobranchus kaupii]|uniref:Uncharacterized protein n=1 Tax=Synaphobranchus kaupii TaxID=118154 RepID=A0A9Q1IBV8_SYNKA|nr:hypothetical protein SKAU_G00404390 [Synaphobranchus kaupii]